MSEQTDRRTRWIFEGNELRISVDPKRPATRRVSLILDGDTWLGQATRYLSADEAEQIASALLEAARLDRAFDTED